MVRVLMVLTALCMAEKGVFAEHGIPAVQVAAGLVGAVPDSPRNNPPTPFRPAAPQSSVGRLPSPSPINQLHSQVIKKAEQYIISANEKEVEQHVNELFQLSNKESFSKLACYEMEGGKLVKRPGKFLWMAALEIGNQRRRVFDTDTSGGRAPIPAFQLSPSVPTASTWSHANYRSGKVAPFNQWSTETALILRLVTIPVGNGDYAFELYACNPDRSRTKCDPENQSSWTLTSICQ